MVLNSWYPSSRLLRISNLRLTLAGDFYRRALTMIILIKGFKDYRIQGVKGTNWKREPMQISITCTWTLNSQHPLRLYHRRGDSIFQGIFRNLFSLGQEDSKPSFPLSCLHHLPGHSTNLLNWILHRLEGEGFQKHVDFKSTWVLIPSSLSFLRKQESRRESEKNNPLDTRFRGYDKTGRVRFRIWLMSTLFTFRLFSLRLKARGFDHPRWWRQNRPSPSPLPCLRRSGFAQAGRWGEGFVVSSAERTGWGDLKSEKSISQILG